MGCDPSISKAFISILLICALNSTQWKIFKKFFECYHQQVGTKRKRENGSDDKVQGAGRVRKFLQDIAALPVDKMSREETFVQLKALKSDFDKDTASNSWLQQVV